MKKIGIVGGLGPESTLDYYKGLIEAFKASYEQSGYPEISIESLDLKVFMELIQNEAWDSIADIVSTRFEVLRKGGAQIGAIASNTPHKAFEQIQRLTQLPLVSIIEATCDHAVAAKFENPLSSGHKSDHGGRFLSACV